jgi:uncharacterized protein YbjT (DUF2867 family)
MSVPAPRRPGSFDVVTGAYGQTGGAIAAILARRGREVRTLTRARPGPGAPYPAIDPGLGDEALVAALRGCDVLHSTLWARFGVRGRYAPLVEQNLRLARCARRAGVRRWVQVTVANLERGRGLPYWDGKAALEAGLREAGLPCSFVRPTLVFGPDDTLVNNAAWAMRRLRALPIAGPGRHRVRPVFVGDLAEICVRHGDMEGMQAQDAVGPETFTYRGLMEEVRDALRVRAALPRVPRRLAWLAGKLGRPLVRDTVLTWQEVRSLERELYWTDGPATGTTRFTEWVRAHADGLGRTWRSQRRRAAGKEYPGLTAA